MSGPGKVKKCDCGHDFDDYGYHSLNCKYGVDLCGLTIQSSMSGVSACLAFTFPIKQNQDINISILKIEIVQTLQCLIQILDRIWILMCHWLIHGVRTLLGGLARKWSCCHLKKRKNESVQKSLFQEDICQDVFLL